MDLWNWFAAIVTALLVIAGSHAAHAEPLRIFHFTYVGDEPLFVAQEKGFFAKEGIEVSLIRSDEHTAMFAALAAGQVDAVAGSLQDIVHSRGRTSIRCNACLR